ncbi:MAG: hypothetical protein JOY68_01550 [Candidatus Dormibacteraeota bacterium]|nr:hypothetical protein [Candidatus Dormibacteraeota bacterium]MBV8446331.1 hypothetical protein [Candidatus Dormibacteraeota bacterium]
MRIVLAVASLVSVAVLGTGTTVRADDDDATVCHGGPIAPGEYDGLTIDGFCFLASSGTITVDGTLLVQPGQSFFANYPPGAMGSGSPEGDATLVVWGDVRVQDGAMALLGCDPEISCVNTVGDAIHGDVVNHDGLGVIIHDAKIWGNLSIRGGGGGINCSNPTGNPAFSFGVYNDLETSWVGGEVSVHDVNSCWFGLFNDEVKHDVSIDNNTFADPDATEIASNDFDRNVRCFDNVPAAQIGDSGGSVNKVKGEASGQCAAISVKG